MSHAARHAPTLLRMPQQKRPKASAMLRRIADELAHRGLRTELSRGQLRWEDMLVCAIETNDRAITVSGLTVGERHLVREAMFVLSPASAVVDAVVRAIEVLIRTQEALARGDIVVTVRTS